jgi:hypothetical protein
LGNLNKRALGKPRRRREDNIRMDLEKIAWEGEDWIHLVHDRDQWRADIDAVMDLRFP